MPTEYDMQFPRQKADCNNWKCLHWEAAKTDKIFFRAKILHYLLRTEKCSIFLIIRAVLLKKSADNNIDFQNIMLAVQQLYSDR